MKAIRTWLLRILEWLLDFFGTTLKGRHGYNEFGVTLRPFDLHKTLGYSPHTSLCSCPKAGYHGLLRATT